MQAAQLFNSHRQIATIHARSAMRRLGLRHDFREVMGWALLGLWDAAQRFDPARGAEFETYAKRRVVGAIYDEARRFSPFSRVWKRHGEPVPELVEFCVGVHDEPSDDDQEADTVERDLWVKASRLVMKLRGIESTVVVRYYFDGQQFKQIADELGMSRSWVCRIHQQALDRLRRLAEC